MGSRIEGDGESAGDGRPAPPPFCRDGADAADVARFCEERIRLILSQMDPKSLDERGVDAKRLGRALDGEAPVTLEVVVEAAVQLELSMEWVFFGAGPKFLKDVPRAVISAQCPQDLLEHVSEAIEDLL